MNKIVSVLPPRRETLLWKAIVSLGLLIVLTNTWTSPPIHSQPVSMAFMFNKKSDPNSIDGRIAVGYWEDEGPGSAENAQVDKDWDPRERKMVIDYLNIASDNEGIENGPIVLQRWRGLAFCRLCDEALGNTCMGDSKYNWPQGYAHYIEKHHVKPPQKFIDHIREQTKRRTDL